LLILEFGEYFFEDVSAFQYPNVPIWSDKSSIISCDGCKIQGRIKLCSKSLIFEPNDIKRPLIKIPFKSITSNIAEPKYGVKSSVPGIDLDSVFILSFKCYVEIKANDKIGPYQVIDCRPQTASDDFARGYGCFALVHSDLKLFLSKVDSLYRAYRAENAIQSEKILRPLLMKANTITFDSSMLIDFHEQLILSEPVQVKKIKPLIMNPGSFMVTTLRVYFQPSQLNNLGDSFQCFELSKVDRMFCRRYLLQQIGLEFILKDGSSHLFTFEDHGIRNKVFLTINEHTSIMSNALSLEKVTRQWQRREKSNFEYLLYLNNEADRSFNDLTQYPVFPHIIQDFQSTFLDMENPATYRDLSKPIGALNADRLEYFKERYNSMPPANEDCGIPPPFLYGTHYSTPAYVLFYLVRVAPEHMLCLQNGKFDATDRMFNSISETWESCLTNPADLKELIPEFFNSNGEFLTNASDLDFGHRHTGGRLNDVDLPPWAKSPKDFIRKCSKALESEYVSANLHKWIDLIFGYKSVGLEAALADNLYYYLTYEGAIDLEQVTDPQKRTALEIQIQEFGQTPKQLFSGAHPSRNDINAPVNVRLRSIFNSQSSNDNSFVSASSRSNSPQPRPYEDGVINLGDDFRVDVQRALSTDQENPSSKLVVIPSCSSNDPSNRPLVSPAKESASQKISSFFSDFALKTASISDRALGTKLLPTLSNTLSSKATSPKASPEKAPFPPSSIGSSGSTAQSSFETDPRHGSSKALSFSSSEKISLSASPASISESGSAYDNSSVVSKHSSHNLSRPPRRFPTISLLSKRMLLIPSEIPFKAHNEAISSVSLSVDAVMDDAGEGVTLYDWKAFVCSSSSDASLKVMDADSKTMLLSTKRSYIGSDAALTSCRLTHDGKLAYFGSWDNHVYVYSIQNARLLSKQLCHDDGVTSISIDDFDKYLLTGSNDGAVKLWSIKNSGLSSVPVVEFYDHENAVTSVALTYDSRYAAAASVDGKVIVWDTRTGIETCTYQLPSPGRPSLSDASDSFSDKLIISSEARIVCINTSGKLLASINLDVVVHCLDSDGTAFYAGCDDGTIRVWIMEGGTFKEIHRYIKAHKAVTSIQLDSRFRVLVTGGSDGTVRIWKTFE
jgi:WD40 repeat protein